MTRFGYARVSSTGQSLDDQTARLLAAGCARVLSEKQSGKSADDRAELQTLLAFVRADDEVVVTKIDRLARSVRDLLTIVERLRAAGANLVILDQQIDTATPAGMAFLQMLGVFAEFERALILERQRSGIAAARAAGRSLGGRPAVIPRRAILDLLGERVPTKEIARRLKVSLTSVYRIMNEGAKQ